jgi:hypothetical protein
MIGPGRIPGEPGLVSNFDTGGEVMQKLITGVIVAAALAVLATPAFAIHDGTRMPGAVCSNPDSKAVGNNPNPGSPPTGFSNGILAEHNPRVPDVGDPSSMPCTFND